MPLYRYKALSQPGEVIEGDLDAPDRAAVVDYLRNRGYLPLRAEEKGEDQRSWLSWQPGRRRPISRQDEITIYRETATLLSAGLPLDQALHLLITYATRRQIADVMTRVLSAIRDGASLSTAMAAQGQVFDRFGLGMVRAGEAGGTLDTALAKTATYLETSERSRQNLKSALIYPVILLVSAGLSIVVIISVVVPSFAGIFEQAGVALPAVTRVVVWTGEAAAAYWWAPVLAILGAVLALLHGRRSEAGRREWDARLLKIPLLGPLIAKSEIARLSYTLGMLIGNGVPLVSALAVTRAAVRNAALADLIAGAEKEVKEGRRLADPLARASIFPAHATHLVRIGEESGRLESMLFKLSEMYDEKVQQETKRLLTILTPTLTLAMALLIAGIIVSILVPMLSMYEFAF